MFSILQFENTETKLKSLLSESNHFDSLLFIFDGWRRYKMKACELGIKHPSDLLLPHKGFLSALSPHWSYYLYGSIRSFNLCADGLSGVVRRLRGEFPSHNEVHVFVSRDKTQIKMLYLDNGDYVILHRKQTNGLYRISEKEQKIPIRKISWCKLNHLLTNTKNARKKELK